ncbi:MAG: polygalacturonase [Gammaproteobacteria bacterium]|nr:polygalacturonase [Gammaproteobacteria bacterium]
MLRQQKVSLLILSLLCSFTCGVAVADTSYDALLPAEPKLPTKVCKVLLANLAQQKGLLPDAVDSNPKKSNPDTARLQAAIDNCPVGQAVKLVADGSKNAFLAGPFSLASGVTLWVDKDVTLFASRSPADYDLGDGVCGDALPDKGNRCKPWITASNTHGGGIVGEGTIDGRGGSVLTSGPRALQVTWWDLAMQSKARPKLQQNNPRMIEINGGSDFTLYKINIQNAPKFHFVGRDLDGLIVWGVKVLTPSLAYTNPGYQCAAGTYPAPGKIKIPSTCFMPEVVKNTDGIDPATSKNVTVAYSFISTGDDNVAIKSGGKTSKMTSTNHLYAHNHFYYGHGMSIGSETDAGVSDIKIWDLIIDGYDSEYGVGLRIKSDSKRGGEVKNIIYQDVCMRRIKEPLLFSPYYSSTNDTSLPPNIHDITLSNIHYVDYPGAKYNKSKITFSGYAESGIVYPLTVALDNVVFDTMSEFRKEHYHDVHFKFGKESVVNFPAEETESVTITTIPSLTHGSGIYECLDERFVPFPSPASPL